MTMLAAIRGRRLALILEQQAALYASPPGDLAGRQLHQLNLAWAGSLERSPWARAMRARLGLPDQFANWGEVDSIPVQTRTDLRADLAAAGEATEAVSWRATGGTTAEPFRFPVFASETREAGLDQWTGRARLGIDPADRLFMIWGHAHLFGVGVTGAINRLKRNLSDRALGYTRWSAYRMSAADMGLAAEALIASRARYVIGYSVALDRFARANAGRAAAIHALELKAVIATAEGLPRDDSREVIEACFGCPVVMEYGSVETGVIAYERPGGPYDVFWDRHHLELGEETPAGRALIVTSLNVRALPLLRYAIGDVVRPGLHDVTRQFESVGGRLNDAIVLPDGTPIHSEAFTHVLRDLSRVRVYQIVGKPGGGIPTMRYEADSALPEEALARIRDRLARIDPVLREAAIERVDAIPTSVAGKHRMVVLEP